MQTQILLPQPPVEITEKLCQEMKRELAILTAIIQTVSRSGNLKETLEAALDIVLSVIGSTTGWICLIEEDKSCSAFVGVRGLCLDHSDGEPTPCLLHCVCGRVRRTGEAVVVRQLQKGCPLLGSQVEADRPVVGHVSIPLIVKSRIVGQLNVAFNRKDQAGEIDVELLKTIAPQLAVAVENARLWEQVQEKEALQKELLKKLVLAQEEERRRISRELHDEFGQELTSLLVRLQVLEKVEPGPQTREMMGGIKGTVSQLLSDIHDLALELRPSALDDLGLVPALQQYTQGCRGSMGIEVDFEAMGIDGQRLPREVETTLYRTIQESLTNAARHSQARKASVVLKMADERVVAIIEDHGVGFNLSELRGENGRMERLGLYGMEERVALVGGTLTIETHPGAGTTIYISVPGPADGISHPG